MQLLTLPPGRMRGSLSVGKLQRELPQLHVTEGRLGQLRLLPIIWKCKKPTPCEGVNDEIRLWRRITISVELKKLESWVAKLLNVAPSTSCHWGTVQGLNDKKGYDKIHTPIVMAIPTWHREGIHKLDILNSSESCENIMMRVILLKGDISLLYHVPK